jgi:hypothetical protein
MNIIKLFQKSKNKAIIVYTNNTRIIRQNKTKLEKYLYPEIKELSYRFLQHWQSENSLWTVKGLIILVSVYWFTMLILPMVSPTDTDKFFVGQGIIDEMEKYQTENINLNISDHNNSNKIMYSYWTKYL